MNDQLYIPKKLNVGFCLRSDCYTGRLGYVIYWDDKGKLRKETSWESWRQKPDQAKRPYWDAKLMKTINPKETCGERVAPLILDNVPTEGFVLNKDAGGVGSGWGWNDRMEKVRVYDPRDFEFEISIPNLLFVLQECSSIKGKGLEGEFVYSWSGTELVLLPVGSNEYKESQGFTALQGKKFSMRDIQVGKKYLDKNQNQAVYMGRNFFFSPFIYHTRSVRNTKEHIFYDLNDKQFTKSFKPVEELEDYSDYSKLVSLFKKTDHGKEVVGITEGEIIDSYYGWGIVKNGEQVISVNINTNYYGYYGAQKNHFSEEGGFEIKNGELKFKEYSDNDSKILSAPREAIVQFSDGTQFNLNKK